MKELTDKYDKQLRTNAYWLGDSLARLYNEMAKEISTVIPTNGQYNYLFHRMSKDKKEKLFKKLEPIYKKYSKRIENRILKSIKTNWMLAENKNDAILLQRLDEGIDNDMYVDAAVFGLFNIVVDYSHDLFKSSKYNYSITWRDFKKGYGQKQFKKDLEAYKLFTSQKINGLTLSERVWNLQDGNRQLIKHYLEAGFQEGKSANEMASELRRFLKDPDRVYRRIRNSKGRLITSRPASEYHPGQGVYRSSFKNAKRLAQTEINRAYKTADNNRWRNDPNIVGYEVIMSAVHPKEDMCDSLKGKYPKNFLFTVWHPGCWCQAVPIQASKENFKNYIGSILGIDEFDPTKDKNYVGKVPDNFTQFINRNRDKISKYKSAPYYIKDNFKGGDIKKGLIINS